MLRHQLFSDYLEQMVKDNDLPSITRNKEEVGSSNTRIEGETLPIITRYESEIERLKVEIQEHRQKNALLVERATITLPLMADLETLSDRILFDPTLREASFWVQSCTNCSQPLYC